ncbi:zinc metalloprotease HtpX [Cytobacillus praedii]|uniref:Peptidase M48 domain-containing protein n=1 Tax=Cytobacillus praedii TaxID=1742358 RepID=A0A4R1AZY8_9BACI|nr:zinc metalloprotease HtpX [Cytobacillus praedii]TCJ06269.1 hypothetical protein E0Y62_00220 [Cytobacillus praedii]
MYLIDFVKRLVQMRNISISIYLLLNTILLMLIFQDPILGLILYVCSLALALSPFGEWILRIQQGCKPLSRKEHIDRLMPLFDEVYKKAKQLDPTIADDVKLFLNNDNSPNAFATGRRTICVNKGLLSYSDDEIKAVLAHEFGHLSNKDTDLILIVAVGNMIVTVMFVIYRIIFNVIGLMSAVVNRSIGTLLMTFFIDVVLVGLMWLWTKFGMVLVMHSSRKNEYAADQFAAKCGYGDELIHVIDSFNGLEVSASKGLWANLASSHPDPDERIGNLQTVDAS